MVAKTKQPELGVPFIPEHHNFERAQASGRPLLSQDRQKTGMFFASPHGWVYGVSRDKRGRPLTSFRVKKSQVTYEAFRFNLPLLIPKKTV